MNKPNKCKNCQWYGKPYWSVINPCDNCNREDYYKVMKSYYTEDYVKFLLQEIERLNNIINELEKYLHGRYNEWISSKNKITRESACEDYLILEYMKYLKENNK